MAAVNRFGVIAVLAGLACLLTACPPPKPVTDAGTNPNGDCTDDTDCLDPALFFCDGEKCQPTCHSKEQCTAAGRGAYPIDYCDVGLGCQCDEGKCVGSLCAADSDCGAQVCRNGTCVDAPAASSVDSCQVTPDFAVVRGGSKVKFWVSTWDAAKNPVVLKTGITWTAIGAGLSGTGTSASQEFSVASTSTAVGPVAAVQAAMGTKSCTAKVVVLPDSVPVNNLDVLVTDELSGRPIDGASVMASGATTGTLLGAVQTTGGGGASGYARVALPAGTASVTLSVFHDAYNYLTIANYDASSTGADARFLSVVLRRNQVDQYGGYKGTFTGVPDTGNIHAAIAGMSIAGSITDLSVAQLLGPNVKTNIKIGSIDQPNVPLPAGTYLGFSANKIKTEVSAQGLAGVCFKVDGTPDEAKIAAGACGTRSAWALAGDVPIKDLPIDAFAGGDLDFGKVLGRIVPIFSKFSSSLVRDVAFDLKPTPGADAGQPNFDDTTGFVTRDQVFGQVPLAFDFVVRSPDLPKYRDAYTDGLVLLGGAIVPGRGVVPLGIGAGVNTTPQDAKTDTQGELGGPGLVSLRMAPTHHGLEGADYGIIALALSLKSMNDGLATSALFSRVPNNKIQFDPKGQSVVDIGSSFLGFPAGAKYNYASTGQGALGGRSFKFAADPKLAPGGATAVRVVFTDHFEHRWMVYLDPAQWSTGFTLPVPPGSFTDRTFYLDNTVAGDTRAPLLVQAIRLNDNPGAGGTALTFTKLVELNATNADRMVDFTTAFSFIEVGRPEVSWMTPKDSGATAAKNSAVKVSVSGFKVGATEDGYVKVTVTGAAASSGCGVAADGKVDSSQGKGEISLTLPTDCTGTDLTLTATLYDNSDAALAPAVDARLTGIIIN